MIEEDEIIFNESDENWLKGGLFGNLFDSNEGKERKVKGNCPVTGNYRDAAHKLCKFNANHSKKHFSDLSYPE